MQQQTLVVGDSLRFTTATPQFPASAGWVLKYRLVPRFTPGSAIEIVCTASGDEHLAAVPASTTVNWTAGDYGWASWAEGGTAEKYTVDKGQITLLPDPRVAAAGADTRSVAERAYDQAQAALAAWTPTRRKYRIGDREMEFSSKADIVGVVHYWQAEVAKERRAAALAQGLPDPRKSYVRINRE